MAYLETLKVMERTVQCEINDKTLNVTVSGYIIK